MKLAEDSIKTIAIFRALQLGDFLCAIPAIRALRSAYPSAEVSYIGLPGMEAIINRFPHYFNHFIPFPGYPGLPEQGFDQQAFDLFLKDMQHRSFDLVLQMHGNGSIVNPLVQSMNAKYAAGFCQYANEQTDLFTVYPNSGHEISRHLALMSYLEIPSTGTDLEFPIYDTDKEELAALELDVQPGKYICVHPGSRADWRQWPPLYFANLADYCIDRGYQVILTGTEAEKAIVDQVSSLMAKSPINAAGKTSIGALGALIQEAHALIANCTGVSHIAAALEKQSVIISMDGEPDRWAPLNKELHRTIDWSATPDYQLVFKELVALFFRL